MISGFDGITGAMIGAGTVVNFGSIAGNLTSGIGVSLAGSLTNQSGGVIGGFKGVYGSGGGSLTVVNAGSITGNTTASSGTGVSFHGSLTNQGPGMISGLRGVYGNGGLGTVAVMNIGSITGDTASSSGIGVELSGGGSLTNQGTGTIAGFRGIFGFGGPGFSVAFGVTTIVNSGAIIGNATSSSGKGIMLEGIGSVTNQSSGTISGYIGLYGGSGPDPGGKVTIVNYGSIAGNATSIGGAGVTLGAGVSVTNQSGGTISGFDGISGGAFGPGAVVNYGSIAGLGTNGLGIDLTGGGLVSNAATGSIISVGNAGVYLTGTLGTVVNAGQIVGGGTHVAVHLHKGGNVTNQSGGTITGGTTHGAVYITGAAGTVTNYGLLTGSGVAGVHLQAGGAVLNEAGGTVTSGTNHAGVYVTGGSGGAVSNSGLISGVDLFTGGGVTNQMTGTINGGNADGVDVTGAAGTVINAGSIYAGGTHPAVALLHGGYVNNSLRGTITAIGSEAINIDGGIGTVINAGSLAGGTIAPGIALGDGGTITNAASGMIYSKDHSGVYGTLVAATVLNAGTITGAGTSGTGGVAFTAGGYVSNAATGTITSVNKTGVVIFGGAGRVTNAGTIEGSGNTKAVSLAAGFTNLLVADPGAVFGGSVNGGNAVGAVQISTMELASGASAGTLSGLGSQYINFAQTTIDAGAYWKLLGTNTLAAGATLTNFGTLKEFAAGFTMNGLLVNSGVINIDPSTLTAADITGIGTIDIGNNSTLTASGTVAAGQTIEFTGTNAVLNILDPSAFSATIENQGPTDTVNGLCFLSGTRIATPNGEVPVERLSVGDIVSTHRGEPRRIEWIGTGKVLATRGRRNAATPVIVRKGALADNVPCRDLRVTKGHSLYIDDVLIPVEFLVNHRSIQWDDRAQEVAVYHIELETHDVLIADGAPAESYRDDGNRWLFQNTNAGWALPPQEPCAPVLTGGPVVDAVWRRLLDRAGPRPGFVLTDDPDLHLLVDGARMDAAEWDGVAHTFHLPKCPTTVRIVSRAGAPAELGLMRDPRVLGVALRRITLRSGAQVRHIEPDDALLTDGFHTFEPANGLRWTDGDAELPVALFDGFHGPVELNLHVGCTTQYPLFEDARSCAAAF